MFLAELSENDQIRNKPDYYEIVSSHIVKYIPKNDGV